MLRACERGNVFRYLAFYWSHAETAGKTCGDIHASKDTTPYFDDARFVKAFPLEFPMGVGDLRQPRLRSDFTSIEWLQHLFRYYSGHFLSSNRGHRFAWAAFNTVLLEISHQNSHLAHKRSDEVTLTKADLRHLYESRTDLLRQLTSSGADIPTTGMYWKRQCHDLEWIVRQMAWKPPWVNSHPDTTDGHMLKRLTQKQIKKGNANLRPSVDSVFPDAAHVSFGMHADAGPHGDPLDQSDPDCDVESVDCDEDGMRVETGVDAIHEQSQDAIPTVTPGVAVLDTEPALLWRTSPTRRVHDHYGYGRVPAFWSTLNFPYNYLYEVHRFHQAIYTLTSMPLRSSPATMTVPDISQTYTSQETMRARCKWSLNNPDMIVLMHAIRVELIITCVMSEIVPPDDRERFLFWSRFEFGKHGNPHAHLLAYVAGNPHFDLVVPSEEKRQELIKKDDPNADLIRTWAEAESDISSFFTIYQGVASVQKQRWGSVLQLSYRRCLATRECNTSGC